MKRTDYMSWRGWSRKPRKSNLPARLDLWYSLPVGRTWHVLLERNDSSMALTYLKRWAALGQHLSCVLAFTVVSRLSWCMKSAQSLLIHRDQQHNPQISRWYKCSLRTHFSRTWVYTVINQSFKDCYSKSRNQFIYHGLITLNQGSLLASQSSCFFDLEKSMVLSVKSLCAS